MRYIIIETQTAADGSVAIPPIQVFDDLNVAEQTFHSILSFAAVSALPSHGCMMLSSEGEMLRSETYHHLSAKSAAPVEENEDDDHEEL